MIQELDLFAHSTTIKSVSLNFSLKLEILFGHNWLSIWKKEQKKEKKGMKYKDEKEITHEQKRFTEIG